MKIRDIYEDKVKCHIYIDSLMRIPQVYNNSKVRDSLEYVMFNKIPNIAKMDISLERDDDVEDDDMLDLILPSILRLYNVFYIEIPVLLSPEQLELYQLNYDMDCFIDYMVEKLENDVNCLNSFINLDRNSEFLRLCVDDYKSKVLISVYCCEDLKSEIRKIKLKKLTKNK